MKNIISIFVFLIILGIMILYFLSHINKQVNNIDQIQHSLQKVEEIVPKSEEIYYNSNITDNCQKSEIFIQTQFVLVPRIVINKDFKDIPVERYILTLHDKDITYNNTDLLFHDSVFLYSKNTFYVSLIKKRK